MRTFTKAALASAILGAALIAPTAHAAVTLVFDQSNIVSIPGLTGFATNGAMMDGLGVTATFADGSSNALSWADTGATSGGVTSANRWSLNQSGNTFSNDWFFSFLGGYASNLTNLVLNGVGNFTVFDTTNPNPGTPGSAQGINFGNLVPDADVTATYSNMVAIGAAAAVGDLFQTLSLDFGANGVGANFRFRQDTDNDLRAAQVPEPGTLVLLGLALAAVGATTRRRKTA